MATVKLFGNLRPPTGDPAIEIQGKSVEELLHSLILAYPDLQTAIFSGEGLQAHVQVMVNGRNIKLAAGLETAVTDTDEIAIFPPIAGG